MKTTPAASMTPCGCSKAAQLGRREASAADEAGERLLTARTTEPAADNAAASAEAVRPAPMKPMRGRASVNKKPLRRATEEAHGSVFALLMCCLGRF